jgi:hypothetical protein
MSEQLIHTKVEPPNMRRSRRGLRGQKPPLNYLRGYAVWGCRRNEIAALRPTSGPVTQPFFWKAGPPCAAISALGRRYRATATIPNGQKTNPTGRP